MPFGALIEPEFTTERAMRKTSPPEDEIEPRFFTIPSLWPLPSKRKVWPAMKFWFEMSSEEATKEPPVVITPLLPTTTPCGFTR